MTREEAIQRLKANRDAMYFPETVKALDMAIEALSTPSGDIISRADAIEAVAQQWLFEASAESPYVNDDDIGEYRKLAEELFEDAPSAEAVQGATYNDMNEAYEQGYTQAKAEVVRCKDCKHWDTADGECYGHDHYHCSEENDYCSHGERKEPWQTD